MFDNSVCVCVSRGYQILRTLEASLRRTTRLSSSLIQVLSVARCAELSNALCPMELDRQNGFSVQIPPADVGSQSKVFPALAQRSWQPQPNPNQTELMSHCKRPISGWLIKSRDQLADLREFAILTKRSASFATGPSDWQDLCKRFAKQTPHLKCDYLID